ncbi:E3 ubiquitin-protein ligase topors [Plakobranchus ocellatus]|uniref:E3 ubiquitin-protein ligase Topors n=1 Tax=Plakobranchus ocellatus TaxID=259542 RepID=A0AAV3ZKP1_9GAST|nr:E3 ubiquitin-protein ligase topors [Plakobranchus ocellatus]
MPVTRNQSALPHGKSSRGSSQTAAPDESSEPSEESASAEASRRDSPDNCSICLGPFNNKSFTSSCAHSFCFECLRQWSKVKAECPLCKQPFTSIFHNVRSNENYDIYNLPPRHVPRPMEYNLYNIAEGNLSAMLAAPSATHFHHYLGLSHPSLDADLTLSNFSRFQFRHRRYMGQHHHHAQHPVHGEHQYSYTGVPVNPSTHVSGDTWPRGAEDFRREVYRRRMGPPVVVLGMENSNYRLTPAMVAASSHRMHRIMPWLTRELRVLLHSSQSVRLAISVIQPLLTQFPIDSVEFLNRVSPLMGRRCQQFVQQFVAFANSALTIQAFDRKAMYQRPDTSVLPDSSSGSSSSDDDVVEITNISPESNNITTNNREVRQGTSGARSGSSATMPRSSVMSSLLSNHGWDSPIPGPSWETLNVVDDDDVQIQEDPVSVSSETDDPVYRPDARNPDSDASKAGSDLVFVKYDKPWNERSPINLSSSTEAEDHSKKKKKSKHKKKSKESESKSHKPSLKIKIRRKHKARRSKDNDEDDYEVGSDSSNDDERRRSQSIGSGDKSSGKKHKKSRDRSRKSSHKNNDRELVDRLFAEAISRPNITSIFQEEPAAAPLQTDSVENRQSSGKGKEKRKKKRRASLSPSTSRAYKKHHSGHKKTSDTNRSSHIPSVLQGHSSHDAGGSGHPNQIDSSATTVRANLSPSLQRPGRAFQPPFLAMPDTVQHIPLNLWVSTWPPLSVSTHAFGTGPSSSTGIPPPLPQALNLSVSRPGGGLGSHTISSSSSSENTCDEEQVTHGNNSSSIPGSHKRTKKWVESNFFSNQVCTSSARDPVAPVPSASGQAVAKIAAPAISSGQQPHKICSFSTDFLLNTANSKSNSAVATTSTSMDLCAKETIEVVCSSDDDQNVNNNEVLVYSSDNDAGPETDSSDDDYKKKHCVSCSSKKKRKRKHSKCTAPKVTSSTKDPKMVYRDTTTLNSDETSSRVMEHTKVSSNMQTPAVSNSNAQAQVDHRNEFEEEAIGKILDDLLDCEQPSLPMVSRSITHSGRFDVLRMSQRNTMSETIVTSCTGTSSAPCMTSFTTDKPVTVITTGSTSASYVTTTPFYLFCSSSTQSSNGSVSSAPTGEGSYLPYSSIPAAPISFPPLLSHSRPLGLHGVPSSFHFQPAAPLISSLPEMYQLHLQGQNVSTSHTPVSVVQENSKSSAPKVQHQDSNPETQSLSDLIQASDQVLPPEADCEEAVKCSETSLPVAQPMPFTSSLLPFSTASPSLGQPTVEICNEDIPPAPYPNEYMSQTRSTSQSVAQIEQQNAQIFTPKADALVCHDQESATFSSNIPSAPCETMVHPDLPVANEELDKEGPHPSIQMHTSSKTIHSPDSLFLEPSFCGAEKACGDSLSENANRVESKIPDEALCATSSVISGTQRHSSDSIADPQTYKSVIPMTQGAQSSMTNVE